MVLWDIKFHLCHENCHLECNLSHVLAWKVISSFKLFLIVAGVAAVCGGGGDDHCYR
jgi:hypothetical protein